MGLMNVAFVSTYVAEFAYTAIKINTAHASNPCLAIHIQLAWFISFFSICFAGFQKRAEPTHLLQVRDLYRMLFAAQDTARKRG